MDTRTGLPTYVKDLNCILTKTFGIVLTLMIRISSDLRNTKYEASTFLEFCMFLAITLLAIENYFLARLRP